MWGGADPGGEGCFGVAILEPDGTFVSKSASSVDDAVTFLGGINHLGIDCPMWWSSGRGGGRSVDVKLRAKYKISSGTIQSVNSLRGAAVVQGILLAMRMRAINPQIKITETHPKVLLKAFDLPSWTAIGLHFSLVSGAGEAKNEHERDALLSAIAAREAALHRWTFDLAKQRGSSELDPASMWFGTVNYWWPEAVD